MKRILILVALSLLSFSISSAQGGGGQSTKRRAVPNKANSGVKSPNVKLPKELILQMAKDDEQVKTTLKQQGGNPVTFAARNFSAKHIDLNGDGKPEWFKAAQESTSVVTVPVGARFIARSRESSITPCR